MIEDAMYCLRSDNVLCNAADTLSKKYIFIKNEKIEEIIIDEPKNELII